jgi:hypothetical protein
MEINWGVNLKKKEQKMKRILCCVAALALFSIPAAAYEYPWKTLPPFEISLIDGYQGSYYQEEQIVFYVGGKSHSRIEIEPQAGFHVQAYIVNSEEKTQYAAANGKFDEYRRAWLITFVAPTDNTKSYELNISLYCSRDNSPCEEVYGRAAQVSIKLPLKVRN